MKVAASLALHCVQQLRTSGNWNANTSKDTLGNKCWSWEASGRTVSCGWCPRSKPSSSGNVTGNLRCSPVDDWWFSLTGWILQSLKMLQIRGIVMSLCMVHFSNTLLQRYLWHWWYQSKISNTSWTEFFPGKIDRINGEKTIQLTWAFSAKLLLSLKLFQISWSPDGNHITGEFQTVSFLSFKSKLFVCLL